MATRPLRSPLAVTLQVWRALFLREAVGRMARDPFGWFWIVAEPAGHIGFLMWIFVAGFRQRQIAGVDTEIFLMIGVLGFFLPRNIFNRGVSAVDASGALYSYRQVKPLDTVIARIGLETLLWFVVLGVVAGGAALAGLRIAIADPLLAMAAIGCLWLAAVGLALVGSVVAGLSTQLSHVVPLLMRPLYFFSGVMFSTEAAPRPIREVLLLNPLVHGLEALRAAFMPAYRISSAISLAYLLQFSVVMIFLGLLLHARFQALLRAK